MLIIKKLEEKDSIFQKWFEQQLKKAGQSGMGDGEGNIDDEKLNAETYKFAEPFNSCFNF